MRGSQNKEGGTNEVFLDLFESGSKENDGERHDGCILVCGGDVWYLLDARGKEKEYVCVFGKLLCGRVSGGTCDVGESYP